MNTLRDDEPENAGLIQSKPPTKKELREISLLIAQSKKQNDTRMEEIALPAAQKKRLVKKVR